MRKADYGWVGVLALFGTYIWFHDRRWLAAAGDVLPILVGLPLFVWLKWPLRFRTCETVVRLGPLLAAAILFALGVLVNSTLLLSISWTLVLWSWLSSRLEDGDEPGLRRLMILPLLSFPWIATDFERLGWMFRLSGAAAVENFLIAGNANVTREGTFLLVNGFQLSVEPACSGLNGLQSMLTAGTMLAFITLRQSRLFWPSLLVLPFAAWLANFIRILSGAVVPMFMEPAAAARWVGPLHSFAGWLALCAMFGICWMLFSRLARVDQRVIANMSQWARRAPWLEIAILGYGGWRCAGLLNHWFTTPFDRWGWLAFALWILPIGLHARNDGLPAAGSGGWRSGCLGAAVALIFLGDAGELNAIKYAGLAMLFIGFAPRPGLVVWTLAAVAWMPVFGWVATRFGVSTGGTALARVAVALCGCLWASRALWSRGGVKNVRELAYVRPVNSTS